MKKFIKTIARFINGTHGPTAVEYAVIIALIFLVCFTAVIMLGQQTNSSIKNSSNQIRSSFEGGK